MQSAIQNLLKTLPRVQGGPHALVATDRPDESVCKWNVSFKILNFGSAIDSENNIHHFEGGPKLA